MRDTKRTRSFPGNMAAAGGAVGRMTREQAAAAAQHAASRGRSAQHGATAQAHRWPCRCRPRCCRLRAGGGKRRWVRHLCGGMSSWHMQPRAHSSCGSGTSALTQVALQGALGRQRGHLCSGAAGGEGWRSAGTSSTRAGCAGPQQAPQPHWQIRRAGSLSGSSEEGSGMKSDAISLSRAAEP